MLPEVRTTIHLDRPRTLVLDWNAYAEFEGVTGLSLLVDEITFDSMFKIRAIVWAGLLHEDPDLTIQNVGTLLSNCDSRVLMNKITEAVSRSMPEPVEKKKKEEDADEPDRPTNPPPGAVFGQPDDTT
jgi:hypothetical protein